MKDTSMVGVQKLARPTTFFLKEDQIESHLMRRASRSPHASRPLVSHFALDKRRQG